MELKNIIPSVMFLLFTCYSLQATRNSGLDATTEDVDTASGYRGVIGLSLEELNKKSDAIFTEARRVMQQKEDNPEVQLYRDRAVDLGERIGVINQALKKARQVGNKSDSFGYGSGMMVQGVKIGTPSSSSDGIFKAQKRDQQGSALETGTFDNRRDVKKSRVGKQPLAKLSK